jgi:protein-S-isoprenylcysteine O-methyltransferase Ste14
MSLRVLAVVPTAAARRSVDIGRVVVVAFAAVALAAVAFRTGRGIGQLASPRTAVGWVAGVLTGAFYVLTIRAYLKRVPAIASNRSFVPNAAAVTGTLLPAALVLLHPRQVSAGQLVAADLCLITGLLWSLWSLRTLGRCVSVLAQARSVVTAGPYRWIRHPLYAGEIVSTFGIALSVGTASAMALAWILVALQLYRAVCEERVLVATMPEYRDYRRRTSRIVPGIF